MLIVITLLGYDVGGVSMSVAENDRLEDDGTIDENDDCNDMY